MRALGAGFRVRGLRLRDEGVWLRFWVSEFRVLGSGFRGFHIHRFGCRVQGAGSRVQGWGLGVGVWFWGFWA